MTLTRNMPNLVTLHEAARLLGASHRFLQAAERRARNGVQRRKGPTFPPPALTGRTARLWDLDTLATWVAAQEED